MNKLIAGATAFALTVTTSLATANDTVTSPTSTLIKGFAQYQASRVERLILDEFVADIAADKYFRRFFPKTAGAIAGYKGISGKRLIPLMQYYFDLDVETMESIAACFNDIDKKLKDPEKVKNATVTIDGLWGLADPHVAYDTATYLGENKDCLGAAEIAAERLQALDKEVEKALGKL